MALDHESPNQIRAPLVTRFRWLTRRGVFLRRRKLPTIRLGGKRPQRLVRILRRMRVKWLKAYYARMLKKVKDSYNNLIKDMIEAGATIEAYQQRVLMETSFAVPVLGVSLSNFPSIAGSDHHRYYM